MNIDELFRILLYGSRARDNDYRAGKPWVVFLFFVSIRTLSQLRCGYEDSCNTVLQWNSENHSMDNNFTKHLDNNFTMH